MKIKSIVFFPGGNTAVFDEDGNQISHLQKNWFLEFLKQLHYMWEDFEEAEILLPGGKVELEKIEDGDFTKYDYKFL